MKIQEKTKMFEESCQRLLQREVLELNKKIDTEIEQQIKDELQEYEEKEELAYQKKLEKLEKEYNKQLYSLEMESKKEVLEAKKLTQKDLKKEVFHILKNFIQTPEYEAFFMKRIEDTFQKLSHTNTAILSLTRLDFERYGEKVRNQYQVQIQVMEDQYIGGCILEDKVAGIYIDNTIQNSVQEKLN